MKSLYALIIVIGFATCDHPRQITNAEFPLDSLLNIADTAGRWNQTEMKIYWSYDQEARLYWVDKTHVLPIRAAVFSSTRQGDPYLSPGVPRMWHSRDGLNVFMSIDTVQHLNGKPFNLYFDGCYLRVNDWNGGKLTGSNTDLAFASAFQPDHIVSSQELIDMHDPALIVSMSVWAPGIKARARALENPGDYSIASTRILSEADFIGRDTLYLNRMRLEIFARHGLKFPCGLENDYFMGKPWYQPASKNVDMKLTDTERRNLALITAREKLLIENNQ